MDFKEARKYIKEMEKSGSVFDLDGINFLLEKLGHPEKGIPAIHIAGTNGKGSILAFVEETLIRSGYDVGRYISPTIYDYRERWKHNKKWASYEDVAEVITVVKDIIDNMSEDECRTPTAFEIETAAAFLLFKKWGCDVILVECGMGGRLDATNVLEEDVINVIASISLDHMQVLGKTLKEITAEKLGIVRDGTTIVTYPQSDLEVLADIRDYAMKHNVHLIETDIDSLHVLEDFYHKAVFEYKGAEFDISMGGHYQIYNAITAIEVLRIFEKKMLDHQAAEKKTFRSISDEIFGGLLATTWDGRYTVANINPLIIVDGAHNLEAWCRLRESIDKYFTNRDIIYIIGVLADKEYRKMIEILLPTMSYVYTVQSDSPRALPAEELARYISQEGIKAEAVDDIRDAIDMAAEKAYKAEKETVVVVCGTLSITGDAISYIRS